MEIRRKKIWPPSKAGIGSKLNTASDMFIQKNQQATGGEKWEVHKIMGVGVAMANNYAVIEING